MPDSVHGFCVIDKDGVANVYLNVNDPEERQKKALKHELLHIVQNDHYRDRDIAEAEVDETLDNYDFGRRHSDANGPASRTAPSIGAILTPTAPPAGRPLR